MDFFGKIGIDWGLLLAQAANFALLVWILNRFAIKPLLKGMETGELERAESTLKKVEEERQEVERSRQAAVDEVKEKTDQLMTEAQKTADQIRERALGEAQKERAAIIDQVKRQVSAQKETLAAALAADGRKNLARDLAAHCSNLLERSRATDAVQLPYFADLLEAVAGLTLSGVTAARDVRLDFAVAPTAEQEKKLRSALEKKTRLKGLTWEGKRDAGLLAGFRLEIGGVVIEKNLLTDIRHAVQTD